MDKSDFDKMNEQVLAEFRANGGKVGGRFEGQPVILLHHKGAKSGKIRVNPLVYTENEGRFVLIASKGGDAKHPDWYHNLKAHPDLTVEVGTETYQVRAEEIYGEERQRLFDEQAEVMPYFKDYEKKTEGIREIPVFVLNKQ